jgi:drug/metabolite transporter (DMT)-like permease
LTGIFGNLVHLLLPLLASVLFVCGLIFIKRLTMAGVGSFTIIFSSNLSITLAFTVLWFFGGTGQPATQLWQPAIVAALFMLGTCLQFFAVRHGDVSVAAPILGVKVVFVAFFLWVIENEQLPKEVWFATCLAALGIGLIQWTGRHSGQLIMLTIVMSLASAACFAMFDVLVQRWAPAWGPGRLLPIVFWMVSLMSLAMLPWVQWHEFRDRTVQKLLIPASILVSLQALCIIVAVAAFGDAARINVVYSLRGIWGVGLAWGAAMIWGGAEADLRKSAIFMRAFGAVLLTLAVVLAIFARV